MIDIVKRRYLYFGISLLVIIPGMIALLVWGLPLAIDFKGGSLLDISFDHRQRPSTRSSQCSLCRKRFHRFNRADLGTRMD